MKYIVQTLRLNSHSLWFAGFPLSEKTPVRTDVRCFEVGFFG